MLSFLKHELNNDPYMIHDKATWHTLVKKNKKNKTIKKKTKPTQNKPTKTTMKRLLTFINISHEEEL